MTRRFTPSLPEDKDQALKALFNLANTDREAFRLQASDAFKQFTPQDRKITAALETETTSAHNVLNAWKTTLQPLFVCLETNRNKTSFHASLAKQLLITKEEAKEKVESLINERHYINRAELIKNIYEKQENTGHQQRHAFALLASAPAELDRLYRRHTHYMLYRDVAAQCAIAVLDPHASWLTRKRLNLRITEERKKTLAAEHTRLRQIDRRLTELSTTYHGLLGKVLERDWDLVVIISLRNQYEKKLKNLSEQDTASPLKRLAIFEKVTKDFRNDQVERFARNNPTQNSLTVARAITQTIDELLLQIFDLSNAEKNQLLVLGKEARELSDERQTIQQARKYRQQLLQQFV